MLTKIQCEGVRKLIWDFIFNLGFYSQREAEQFKFILFIAFFTQTETYLPPKNINRKQKHYLIFN